MSFTTPVFLFLFFPLTLLGYYLIHPRLKNGFLTLMSLAFYAWAEPKFVLVFVISIAVNYFLALLVDRFGEEKLLKLSLIVLAMTLNLSLLFYYKYLIFGAEILNGIFKANITLTEIVMPLGISFFTFRSVSYVADVYFGKTKAQKNPINVALYISFFPQVSMGPITRSSDFFPQLKERRFDLDTFTDGIKRFIVGMAKKLIIADSLSTIVASAFQTSPVERTVVAAWTGFIGYCLQLFFDFSGYSDMAIGIGKMFGFKTPENFDYPYMATSITDFWRRWHITLGDFFKNYVYIPLGGNRKGNVYVHIFIVFLLTGLWHGAAWNFVVWGLWHGSFRLIELAFKRHNKELKVPAAFKHLYAVAVVGIGWVLFRASDLGAGIKYLGNLIGIGGGGFTDSASMFTLKSSLGLFIIGILFCFPVARKFHALVQKNQKVRYISDTIVLPVAYMGLLLVCVSYMQLSSYNPFLYNNF